MKQDDGLAFCRGIRNALAIEIVAVILIYVLIHI